MKCACISENVDDYWETLIDKSLTSSVGHICSECKRDIQAGEEHHYEKISGDGRYVITRTCSDCDSVRKHLVCDFYMTQMWDLVRYHIDCAVDNNTDLPWAKIGQLTPRAQATVCEMIEEAWSHIQSATR